MSSTKTEVHRYTPTCPTCAIKRLPLSWAAAWTSSIRNYWGYLACWAHIFPFGDRHLHVTHCSSGQAHSSSQTASQWVSRFCMGPKCSAALWCIINGKKQNCPFHQATAISDKHKTFGKDCACGMVDILTDRHTHTQTCSSQYFATAPAGEVIIKFVNSWLCNNLLHLNDDVFWCYWINRCLFWHFWQSIDGIDWEEKSIAEATSSFLCKSITNTIPTKYHRSIAYCHRYHD